MSDSDGNSTESGFLERVRRAVAHAEEAARCYLALIASEGRRLARGLMQEAFWCLALLGFGLVGLVVIVLGLAAFVESRIGVPGSGQMIIGGLMVVIFLCVVYVLRARENQP